MRLFGFTAAVFFSAAAELRAVLAAADGSPTPVYLGEGYSWYVGSDGFPSCYLSDGHTLEECLAIATDLGPGRVLTVEHQITSLGLLLCKIVPAVTFHEMDLPDELTDFVFVPGHPPEGMSSDHLLLRRYKDGAAEWQTYGFQDPDHPATTDGDVDGTEEVPEKTAGEGAEEAGKGKKRALTKGEKNEEPIFKNSKYEVIPEERDSIREDLLVKLKPEFQTIVTEHYGDESLEELTERTTKYLKNHHIIAENGFNVELKITEDAWSEAGMLPEPKGSKLGGSISIATEYRGKPTFDEGNNDEGNLAANGKIVAAYVNNEDGGSLHECKEVAKDLSPIRVLTVEYWSAVRRCKIVPAVTFHDEVPVALADFFFNPGEVSVEDMQQPYTLRKISGPSFNVYFPVYPERKEITFNLKYWESE